VSHPAVLEGVTDSSIQISNSDAPLATMDYVLGNSRKKIIRAGTGSPIRKSGSYFVGRIHTEVAFEFHLSRSPRKYCVRICGVEF
jgi:hypothetical protein